MDNEHLKFENGVFRGLYTINVQKAKEIYGKGKFWEGVEAIISDYARVHPHEMKEMILYNDVTKRENFNKYGADSSKSFRHAMEIPVGLHSALTEYDAELFTDRTKLNKLMKKYPALCACAVA